MVCIHLFTLKLNLINNIIFESKVYFLYEIFSHGARRVRVKIWNKKRNTWNFRGNLKKVTIFKLERNSQTQASRESGKHRIASRPQRLCSFAATKLWPPPILSLSSSAIFVVVNLILICWSAWWGSGSAETPSALVCFNPWIVFVFGGFSSLAPEHGGSLARGLRRISSGKPTPGASGSL